MMRIEMMRFTFRHIPGILSKDGIFLAFCRFVNDVLHNGERKKDGIGRLGDEPSKCSFLLTAIFLAVIFLGHSD